MRLITLPEIMSTNSYCKERAEELSAPVAVRAVAQTSGRGQRGNSWESEPGKNLTFSILWHPSGILPREQFSISEAVALGVCDYLMSRGVKAKVKWPNDIYVGDKKICGILIEHSLTGNVIERSVIGVGINVNQEIFHSDAPNPVSMRNLTSSHYDLEAEMEDVAESIESRLLLEAATEEGRGKLHSEFVASLWRGDGKAYNFRDTASGNVYEGKITGVELSGYMTVADISTGEAKRYAFKEVEFIL